MSAGILMSVKIYAPDHSQKASSVLRANQNQEQAVLVPTVHAQRFRQTMGPYAAAN